jgi:hypothetical protein
MSDNSSQVSDAHSIVGGLSDFDLEQLYPSSSSESHHKTTLLPPESVTNSDSPQVILPAGFRSAPEGKRPNTSWIWQHGQEIIKIRDGTSFWLCQLC